MVFIGLNTVLSDSLKLAMNQDRLLIQYFRKFWNFVLENISRCASRPGWSIYLFLLCQTTFSKWLISLSVHKVPLWLSGISSGCVAIFLYCRHVHCGMALLELFLFCEVVLLNTCPTTFPFFCFRLFCFSHLRLPIKYFWLISLGLWLMVFSLVTETTYSQIISRSSTVQTKNS